MRITTFRFVCFARAIKTLIVELINIVEVTNGQTTKNIMRKEINLDIDIYKDEDIKTKNIYSIIKNMIEMNRAKAENLTNYIRGD